VDLGPLCSPADHLTIHLVSALALDTVPTEYCADLDVVDIVDGRAGGHDVDKLASLHLAFFPQYWFVADEIMADAVAPPLRRALVVHQWLVRCEGAPAGFVLFDCNLARRVALVHFIAVTKTGGLLRIDGQRLSVWLCRQVLATLTAELAEHVPDSAPLGVVGESPERAIRFWSRIGFRRLPVPYAEPEAGRHWHDLDDSSMRPLALLWLPAPGIDAALDEVDAAAAGAAAFLLDHYRLPRDHATVVATAGAERDRPGARR
jgi:hypothetical protein